MTLKDDTPGQRYQATVETAASSPFSMPPSSPPRDSYWENQHSHSQHPQKSPVQPIQDAVSNAFDKSDANAQISPELVQQITQAVIQNMRMTGITVSPQPAGASQESSNISTHSPRDSMPPRDMYTPPLSEADHGRGAAPEIRLNNLDNSHHDEPLNPQPYGPKMSLEREYPLVSEPAGPEDTSTLEKIWQPLFEADGYPTMRLSQFLRGVAAHVIEDFEPRNSLVITPAKMKMFFDEVKIDNEAFPWSAVFGGALGSSSISHCYRDLLCEHYFVQKDAMEKPSIPALTPNGFQLFCTHLIRAYPDEEAQRYSKVLQLYAIGNADDRKERFPKQLPRCLFPKSSHRDSRRDLEEVIIAHPDLAMYRRTRSHSDAQSRSKPANAPPQPQSHAPPTLNQPPYVPAPPTSAPVAPQYSKPAARDIPPYPLSSAEKPRAGNDASKNGRPIERERKPYAAAPGGGKSYEQESTMTGLRRTQSNAGARPTFDEEAGRSRHQRSESSASHGVPVSSGRRGGARSPSARRGDSGEDLTKLNSRDCRDGQGERRGARLMAAPNSSASYDDDRRRSLTGAPPGYSQAGYPTYVPPPPQPRH